MTTDKLLVVLDMLHKRLVIANSPDEAYLQLQHKKEHKADVVCYFCILNLTQMSVTDVESGTFCKKTSYIENLNHATCYNKSVYVCLFIFTSGTGAYIASKFSW